MNTKPQSRGKDLTPRTIVLSLCLFVLATTGIMAVVVKAMTGPATAGTVQPGHPAVRRIRPQHSRVCRTRRPQQ